MIDVAAARDHIASGLCGSAQLIALDDAGRTAVAFRAFDTDATLMITKPEQERLAGCVVFAEVQDPRISLELVNSMNQRINFGSVRYYDPNVAIVSSGSLFDPDEPIENLDKLFTAWSDTVDQFWTILSETAH